MVKSLSQSMLRLPSSFFLILIGQFFSLPGTLVFFYSAYSSVFILYLYDSLNLNSAIIGIITSSAAVGRVIGALLASGLVNKTGPGLTLIIALLTCAAGAVITPVYQDAIGAAISQCVMWVGMQIYNIHQVPVRYALAPKAIHGRVNASIRSPVWGLAPPGALFGSLCGAYVGKDITLMLAGTLIAAAALWIFFSPLRKVHTSQLLTVIIIIPHPRRQIKKENL